MPRISETDVRTAVALWLRRHGFGILDPKEKHQKGADIRARHVDYARYFIVEVKGDPTKKAKQPDGSRYVDFMTAIGQIVTRMKTRAFYYYGLAFPKSYEKQVRKLPWRFCKKNRISVFLVDGDRRVDHLRWKDLKDLDKAA